MRLLSDVARDYIEDHPDELSANYVTQLYDTIRVFGRFLGTPPRIEHLTTELVNAWLGWLDATGKAPATRKSRRSALMAIWRYAWEERLTDEPARCKRIRLRTKAPVAWTPEEVTQLVDHCRGLPGKVGSGVLRGPYLASLLMALYTTGLRIGDLLPLRWTDIGEDGSVEVICSKTGRAVIRYLSPGTISLLAQSGAEARQYLWPLWGAESSRRRNLFRCLRRAIDTSPLPPDRRQGTSKWIRRAGATEIARTRGEREAQQFLDHRHVQTTRSHYIDGRYTRSCFRGPDWPVDGAETHPGDDSQDAGRDDEYRSRAGTNPADERN